MFAALFKEHIITKSFTENRKIQNIVYEMIHRDDTRNVQASEVVVALERLRCIWITNAAVVFISHDTTLLGRRMFRHEIIYHAYHYL